MVEVKGFARITSWVLMIIGVLAVLTGFLGGIGGVICCSVKWHKPGFQNYYIDNPWSWAVIGSVLFMGLLLLGVGQVIYLLTEINKKGGHLPPVYPEQNTLVEKRIEKTPPAEPLIPAKPARSRKIAGK